MIRDSLQDDLFAVISNDAIHAATRRASKRPLNNRNIKLVRCFKDTNHISNLWYKNNNLLTCMIHVNLNHCITQ